MRPKLQIAYHTPLPGAERTDQFDLNPSTHSVEITTQLPGGFNTAIISLKRYAIAGMRFPAFPKVDDIRPRGHITIHVGLFLLFEGAVVKTKENNGEIIEVTALGYAIPGLNDNWSRNNEVNVTSSVSELQATRKTSARIIADVLAQAAPLVAPSDIEGDFQDPGTFFIPGEFYGQTPAQIIEAVTKLGGAPLDNLFDMWVYEDRLLVLRPRIAPADIDYTLPFDDTVQWTNDYTNITGQVRVEYTLPDWDAVDKAALTPDHNGSYQTDDRANSNFLERYGFNKSSYVKAGQLTSAAALQFRDGYLKQHESPDVTVEVQRTKWRGLELATGGEVPSYMARAGQWAVIGDRDPLIIVRTKWNNQGQLALELGRSAQNMETLISYLDEASRHAVMGTNPLTGMRA